MGLAPDSCRHMRLSNEVKREKLTMRAIRRFITPLLLLSLWPGLASAWFNNGWTYRVPINIPAAPVNSTVKIDVDFAALLTTLGASGTFDANSPRVVRSNDTTLSTRQEFNDTILAGATDAAANARGEVRFILEDAGATQYYLYFDIVANGPKAANPQLPINGNFEQGFTAGASATLNNPRGWNAVTASRNTFDGQIRPSEPALNITDSGSSGLTSATDGAPYTGTSSFLMGSRTNADTNGGNPAVTLSRSITVPAVSPGNLGFRYRLEGWDSSDNNQTTWDFFRAQIVGGTTTVLVGPTLNNYTTFPFSPNKGLPQISNTVSGYGRYNYWDNTTVPAHTAGMTLAPGAQPWFAKVFDLTPFAGQTVTLQLQMKLESQFKSWVHIDDVEWSVVAATLGGPQTLAMATPTNFNAFETSTAPAGATTGVLNTKIAAQAFGFDVVALNSATPVSQVGTYTGSVKVEIVDGSGAGACASRTVLATVAASYTFAASESGRHTFAGVVVPGVYRDAQVRISSIGITPVIFACSTDHFAIRPNSIALSATHNDWMTAGTAAALNNMAPTAGEVHKAGRPFTLSATAYDGAATPAVAPLYTGTASFALSTAAAAGCTGGACVGAPGTIDIAGAAAIGLSFAAGTVSTATAAYMEAGAVTLQLQDANFASIDSADTAATCTGYYLCSNAMVLGRFVPDSFTVSSNAPQLKTFDTSDASCNAGAASPRRSFTYLGQSFGYLSSAKPVFTIAANNAKGNLTANYAGALWHLSTPATVAKSCTAATCTLTAPAGAAIPTVQTDYTYTSSTASLPGWSAAQVTPDLPVIAAAFATPGTGFINYGAGDVLAFTRSLTTPVSPWNASIFVTPQVNDTSEAAGTIGTATPALAMVAFDSGSQFRYGRLKLSNAHGSELLNLPIPIETQYWNGADFFTNTADQCSRISSAANVAFSNYQNGINATNMASPGNVILGAAFSSGKGSLTLTRPLPQPASRGSVDLTVNLTAEAGTYLQGKWSGATYTVNPTARASFGIYKGSPVIYMRELY